MTKDELNLILDAHAKWLQGDENGKRADLQDADLRGADLRGADLQGADLRGADLQGADLRGADLQGADLRGADLQGADLQDADLRGADLQGADLRGADLQGADLQGADLPFFQICHGELLVWKKARDNRLVQLEIPADAKRTAALVGRKCRAEYAVVVAITNAAGEAFTDATSSHDETITYRVGETIRPDSYNDDIRIECANGIHFFQTREEAEAY